MWRYRFVDTPKGLDEFELLSLVGRSHVGIFIGNMMRDEA